MNLKKKSNSNRAIWFKNIQHYLLHCKSKVTLLNIITPLIPARNLYTLCFRVLIKNLKHQMIVLGFNDTSILVGHFVSSPREREKRDRRDCRGDERGDREEIRTGMKGKKQKK